MSAAYAKQGDNNRRMEATLKYNGAAMDLTTAVSVTAKFRRRSNGATFTKSANIQAPATAGLVWLLLMANLETQFVETFDLEWTIVFNDGRVQTIPDFDANEGSGAEAAFDQLVIVERLAA